MTDKREQYHATWTSFAANNLTSYLRTFIRDAAFPPPRQGWGEPVVKMVKQFQDFTIVRGHYVCPQRHRISCGWMFGCFSGFASLTRKHVSSKE